MDTKFNKSLFNRIQDIVHAIGTPLMQVAFIIPALFQKHEDISRDNLVTHLLFRIREYIRMYYELNKDYRYTYYMEFPTFEMEIDDGVLGQKYSMDKERKTDNNKYDNYNFYFMDTVKNVLYMSQELRDDIKTLFVGSNSVAKLNLVKDMISPDTLVVDSTYIEKNEQLVLLSSVHRVAVRNMGGPTGTSPILLDSYLHVLTDLSVECIRLPEFAIKLITEGDSLTSIRLVVRCPLDNNIYNKLAVAMKERREKKLGSIRSFRLKVTTLQDHSMQPLLEELEHHPLVALGLMITDNECMDDVLQLIDALPDLESLYIHHTSIEVQDIVLMLSSRMMNVTDLCCRGKRVNRTPPSTMATITVEVLKMTNIKNFEVLYANTPEIVKHLDSNRKRDKALYAEDSLLSMLSEDNVSIVNYTNFLGMTAKVGTERRSMICSIYGDAQDRVDGRMKSRSDIYRHDINEGYLADPHSEEEQDDLSHDEDENDLSRSDEDDDSSEDNHMFSSDDE